MYLSNDLHCPRETLHFKVVPAVTTATRQGTWRLLPGNGRLFGLKMYSTKVISNADWEYFGLSKSRIGEFILFDIISLALKLLSCVTSDFCY
jgi:hypothetical protein